MAENKIVKNASKGYGYNYASLADFARQGIVIPEMRTKSTEFGEFVEYKDAEGNWQQGAKVVEMEMKGMNPAQAYGSALTYARRYTVAMAHGIATDDDDAVERAKPAQNGYKTPNKASSRIDFDKVRKDLQKIETTEELEDYWKTLNPASEAQRKALIGMMSSRKKELNG